VSNNKQYIISASDDRSIKIFDFDKKRLLYVINQAHQSGVTSLLLTNDTKYIISASNDIDKHLKIFDFKTREVACSFDEAVDSPITALALTKDNKYIIIGSTDKSIKVFDFQKRQFLFTFDNIHDAPINSVAISQDKMTIVSACYDGSYHILDLSEKKLVHSWKPHEEKITTMITSNDKKMVITASRDLKINIFDMEKRLDVAVINKAHKAAITGLAITSTDNVLISVSRDKCVKFFDFKTQEMLYIIINAHDEPITTVAITSDDSNIITAAEDLSIKIFDFATKQCFYTLTNAQEYPGCSIVITDDSRYMVCESIDRSLHLFDLKQRQNITSVPNTTLVTNLVVHPEIPLVLSRDNKFAIFQLNTCSIGLYDIELREVYTKIENCIDGILTSFAITERYNYLIAGSSKGSIIVLDLNSSQKIFTLENVHSCKITGIVLSDWDKYIISSDMDGRIVITKNPVGSSEIVALDADYQETASIYDLMVLNRFISEKTTSGKILILKKYPHLQIFPYRWNFFHLVCKFFVSRDMIKSCVEFEIPLIVDTFNHTAIHYLFNKGVVDFGLINSLLERYTDLITKQDNVDKIIHSLTFDLQSILHLNTPQVAYFLRIGSGVPEIFGEEEIPHFGQLSNSRSKVFYVSKSPYFTPEVHTAIMHREEEDVVGNKPVIAILMMKFKLNYKPFSKDMLRMLKALNRITNEDIYATQTVSILVEYLWDKNKLFHYSLTLIFSILMILFSIFSGLHERILAFEIIVFVLGLFFTFYELFQMKFTPVKIYFTQVWNLVDLTFNVILLCNIIFLWTDALRITRQWFMSLSLFFGYIKWISFFRVFDSTRKLIRMIIEIFKGIKSFLFIMVFLIFGFALIFYLFNYEMSFSANLFIIYNLLFANSDPSAYSRPLLIYYVIFTIILSIVLLNMLIAIMGDVYQRVLAQRILAEGREKVSLILEATLFIRAFQRMYRRKEKVANLLKKKTKNVYKRLSRLDSQMLVDVEEEEKFEKDASKGFLYFAQKVNRKNQYLTNLFDWDVKMKRTNRQVHGNAILTSEQEAFETVSLNSQIAELKSTLEQQDDRIKELEKCVKNNFEDLEKKLKVKMEEILTAVLEGSQKSNELKRMSTKKVTQKDSDDV